MISEIETTTDPVLSREDAIAILNTPDEELDQLIAQAEKLRRKYKGNHVSIHILTNARSRIQKKNQEGKGYGKTYYSSSSKGRNTGFKSRRLCISYGSYLYRP